MTEKDEKLLAEFEIRMRQLMYLCDGLKEENVQLKQKISQKEASIEELASQVEMLKRKYDNLKFVKSFSSEDQNGVDQAKQRLSRLVREVDKCIAMLRN